MINNNPLHFDFFLSNIGDVLIHLYSDSYWQNIDRIWNSKQIICQEGESNANDAGGLDPKGQAKMRGDRLNFEDTPLKSRSNATYRNKRITSLVSVLLLDKRSEEFHD